MFHIQEAWHMAPEESADPVSILGLCHLGIADDAPFAALTALNPA